MPAAGPTLRSSAESDAVVLHVEGAWRLHDVPAIERALAAAPHARGNRYLLDGSRLESIDTSGAFLLLTRLAALGYAPEAGIERRFKPKDQRLLALVRGRLHARPTELRGVRRGVLHRIGAAAIALVAQLKQDATFAGRVASALWTLARRPRLFRYRELIAQIETTYVDAIPIVTLINFLIGIVVAYVLGVEAQRYGADLFVADGVVLAVCRELSPILGSVLVAGRSGAAFTAQIGTMKVEEEVDAITTLGLSPIQVLVVPRLLALTLAVPLLVLVGDVAGMLGGMIVCSLLLHIPPDAFVDRVHSVLEMRHLFIGLGKAPVFAAFIAMIACRMGLNVKRDARSVGEGTTSTVVQCIVWVIVIDAAFAVLFERLNV